MSDLSLRYLLFGEDRTASKSIKDVGSAAGATGKSVATGLRGIGSLVGGEVGEMIDRVSAGFEQIGEKSKGMAPKLLAGGAALTGIGAALAMIGSKDKVAAEQLQVSIENTGQSFSDYQDQIEATIKKQENYGNSAVQTQDALRILTQATNDPKKALSVMGIAADLAAAKHISLSDAALKVAKVYGGAGRVLKEFGITMTSQKTAVSALSSATKAHETAVTNLDKAQRRLSDLEAVDRDKKKLTIAQQIALRHAHEDVTKAQNVLRTSTSNMTAAQANATKATHSADEAITALGKKVKGEASASVDSFSGKLKVMGTKAADAAAVFGQKYGPAIMIAGVVTSMLGTVMQILAARQAAAAITTDAAGAAIVRQSLAAKLAAAAQWLWNIALTANPIGLVILAIAALVGAIVLIATKTTWFQTIWEYSSHAIAAAWTWLWNSVLQPIISFILTGFSTMYRSIGSFLSALGHVPGFGWAKTAGELMTRAADGADQLNRNLRKIPTRTKVNVDVSFNTLASNLTQALAHNLGSHAVRAAGGPVSAGVPYLVGELRPEVFVPDTNGKILPRVGVPGAAGGSSAGGDVHIHVNGQVYGTTREMASVVLNGLQQLRGSGVKLGLA